jgi:predicted NUDIX family phosphoesterase
MNLHYVTQATKRLPQFILAVDSAYYLSQRPNFVNSINEFPADSFCSNAQSYLTIREREYLDESRSFDPATPFSASYTKNSKGADKKGDPRYKQLLPYLVARQLQEDGTYLYFPYRRTKKVGESRLAGNGSLGYGGHIDLEDIVSTKSIIDLRATILKSAEREAVEEFTLSHTVFGEEKVTLGLYRDAISFANLFIVDNSNDVGELHLGIVMYFDVPQGWTLQASEDELAALPPMTAEQMLYNPAFNGESWTMIYLNHIAGGADVEADDSGCEVEQLGDLCEDDIPGTEGDGEGGDLAPLFNYTSTEIKELPIYIVPRIDPSEFTHLDQCQLLAFTDEQILAMTNDQIKVYKDTLTKYIAGNERVVSAPTMDQYTAMTERLQSIEQNSTLSIDHGGEKVGEADAQFVQEEIAKRDSRIPQTEKEALNLGRGGQRAVEGTPEKLAKIQNRAFDAWEHALATSPGGPRFPRGQKAVAALPVTEEEEEHFKFMASTIGAPRV